MDNEEIIRRYDEQFAQRRSNFDQDADLIERYIDPIRGGKFYQQQSSEAEIEFRRPEVFDSTAMNAANILSASVQSAVTPADTQWFDLMFRGDDMNKDKESVEWLEESASRMFLALQDSRFELTNQEGITSLVNYGNTVIFEEEDMVDDVYKGLLFDAVPIREIYFEENAYGKILNFYRRLQWTPLQIISRFPKDEVPEEIWEKAQTNASAERMDVIFCVFTRLEGGQPFPAAANQRAFGARYVIHMDKTTVGPEEIGYYEMPMFLARWAKTSGSKWGHGPGHLALPTVLTLNTMARQELSYVEKVIDPPSLVDERNSYGTLDLTAGGITVVQDINGIRPYEAGARYGDSKMTQSELRDQVNSIFRVDQLQLKESPAMTATEAQMRGEEILRLLGPTRGRIEYEYLNEVLQRSFNIMMRNGQFEDVPEAVAQYQASGGELDIKYLGPMARAQKADRIASIERFVMTVGQAAQAMGDPTMIDVINGDAMVKELADLGGVPAKLLNSDEDVKAERDERAKQQQEMQQSQQMQERGAGMSAMAEGEQAVEAVQ
jgi:hypothetical protein